MHYAEYFVYILFAETAVAFSRHKDLIKTFEQRCSLKDISVDHSLHTGFKLSHIMYHSFRIERLR